MKKVIIALMISLMPFISYAGEATIKVKGMVCSFCASKLEKSFKERSEVDKVHVDLDKKVIHLVFKDQKQISDDDIKKIITDSGFSVDKVER